MHKTPFLLLIVAALVTAYYQHAKSCESFNSERQIKLACLTTSQWNREVQDIKSSIAKSQVTDFRSRITKGITAVLVSERFDSDTASFEAELITPKSTVVDVRQVFLVSKQDSYVNGRRVSIYSYRHVYYRLQGTRQILVIESPRKGEQIVLLVTSGDEGTKRLLVNRKIDAQLKILSR